MTWSSHFRFMFADMSGGIDGEADHERDVLILDLPSGRTEFSLSHVRLVLDKPYHITKPEGGWRHKDSFGPEESANLRPLAETLAMLDGNAFFGLETDDAGNDIWYRYYLPEAHAIYEANGGDMGWGGESSIGKAARSRRDAGADD